MNSETLSQSAGRRQSGAAYLQLMRPPNVLTSIADSLAGASVAIAIARPDSIGGLILVATASAFLYAGAGVMSDVFEYNRDAVEHPERPIPSGRASWLHAALLAIVLMGAGIGFAAMASPASGWLAGMIAASAILYNGSFKEHPMGGPLFLGLGRGLTLLLGMSLSVKVLASWWPLMLVPILYVGAVSVIGQGKQYGIRHAGWSANALLLAVTASLLLLGTEREYQLMMALPFIAYFAWRVWPLFLRAALLPRKAQVRKAARVGAMSLICLDAAIAGGFGGIIPGLLVLTMLPLSQLLAKHYAV